MSLFDSSSPGIVVLADVPFPANVVGGPGLDVDRADPTAWVVEFDYPELNIDASPTPSSNYVVIHDDTLDLYQRARIDTLVSTATGLDTRTVMGDANYLAQTTDRYIAIASPLTLNRTLTLPQASVTPGGREIAVQDEIGTLNASHYLVVVGTGADTVDGRAQRILSTAYGGLKFRCNGTNAWNVVAVTAVTPVNDTSYTCNMDDHVIAYTALTAARTVTLPLAANYPPGQRLTVMDQVGLCSATLTLTVLPQGSDTINGITTSGALTTGHAFFGFVCDGISRWTIVDNVGGGGGGSITSAQITDASPLGRLLITQTTAAQDRASLGSQSTGDAMFVSSSPAAGRAVLQSGTVGDPVFVANSTAAAGTALGLKSMAYQDSSNVSITGGTISGVTGVGGGGVTVSDTPPGSPTAGALWFDSVGSQLYVWYNDGTSSQWVVATNQNLSGVYLPLTGGTLTGPLAVTTLGASGAITPSQTAGLVGTTAANNAAAGAIGEFLTVAQLTPQAIVSGTAINVTQLTLTAGDWDVEGLGSFQFSAGGQDTNIGLSTTSLTLPASIALGGWGRISHTGQTVYLMNIPTGSARFSLASSTVVYLVAVGAFTTGTGSVAGMIRARRVR